MCDHPEMGSTYRGRVLISLRITKKGDLPSTPVCRPLRRLNASRKPPTKRYMLRAAVYSANDLPNSGGSFAVSVSMGSAHTSTKYQKLLKSQAVAHGEKHLQSERLAGTNWAEALALDGESMDFPADADQLPDVFLYLHWNGDDSVKAPICFARFPAKHLLASSSSATRKSHAIITRPAWIDLRHDAQELEA